MFQSQRVLHNSTDLSVDVNNYLSSEAAFAYASSGYLYIGTEYPFNNLWFDVGTQNTDASTVDIDIWYGNAWVSAVDIIDQTSASGISLYQDGRIGFSTNRLKGWDPEQDSADVTGLSGTYIYNMYWTRWNWSSDLAASTTLKYIGQKFSQDTDLYSLYPDLNNSNLKLAFASGKTDWNDQHYTAAEKIVRDLKHRNIIRFREQILDYEIYREASVHKVAEIIYKGLGQAFANNRDQARNDYMQAMDLAFPRVDLDGSGNVEPIEKVLSNHWVSR